MKCSVDFQSDLVDIIKKQFAVAGVQYDKSMDIRELTVRYFENLNRRIAPTPRQVLLSDKIHDSLGELRRIADNDNREDAAEAWTATFFICWLLSEGENVNGFLTKGIEYATGNRRKDKLLWDFGMHHFHLSMQFEETGFVVRSDYLLFAIVTDDCAYLVDIGPHRDPENYQWVIQDLLEIVNSNWSDIVDSRVLRGVEGTRISNGELHELRRKNVNYAPKLGDKTIMPLGGGMMTDGSSTLCRYYAMEVLQEIRSHQEFFDSQPSEVRLALETNGIRASDEMQFDLVLMDDLYHSKELLDSLRKDGCLSNRLSQFGLAVVERASRSPIVVAFKK